MTEPRTRTPAGTFKTEREPGEALKRDEITRMLSDVLKKLHGRITAARFKTKESDPGWLAAVRAMSATAQALNTTLKDEQIDELSRRIAALEEKQ
ncbi:MAG: hypothetical protein JXA08_05070 [Methanomicrobiaceae archaeon]|nr:hypothetical protein [Methanomicrobiaceae archaeon]